MRRYREWAIYALQATLTSVEQVAPRDRPGIEGGVWQAHAGTIAQPTPI